MAEPDDSARGPAPEDTPAPDPAAIEPAPSRPRRGGVLPRIPGYHIESVIGRGSTGTVYRARQETVDRVVALKVLHAELSARPRMVARLQREARTTARLAHPHIVSAIDMGRTGDRWWFAMELVDGPSLSLRLRQDGPLSEREALRLFIPLVEALVHIHENGVVHRDIKPGNILIDRVSGARLADLGLAFADDDPHLTGSEGTLGTPHYISPEQTRDPSSVDIRSDIWSFGATLFHAVCGQPPFGGANVAEVLSGVLYGRVPDPLDLEPELSRGLALVLRKCLVRDFERRYQSPRELLQDLERVRERRRPKVRMAALDPTLGSGMGLGRRLVLGGAAALLAGAGYLLVERPWEGTPAPLAYAPLTALADEVRLAERPPAQLLAELEGLRAELPTGEFGRWRDLVAGTRARLDGEVDAIFGEREATFRAALDRGAFERAEEAIGVELEGDLVARVGVSLALAPEEVKLRLVPLQHELERALDEAEDAARGKLDERLADPYLAGVQADLAAGRWRQARERLALSPEAVVADLGVGLDAFPDARRERLLGRVAGRLRDERDELDRSWGMLDAQLVSWIDLQYRQLGDELDRELQPIDAAARLREGFERELLRHDLVEEQLLEEPRGLARERLAEAADLLAEAEERIARERDDSGRDALDALTRWLDESACGAAWSSRRCSDVLAFWEGRRDWLMSHGAAASAPWWIDLEHRVGLRTREALLVSSLLEGVAARLDALDGATYELHLAREVRVAGLLDVVESGPAGGVTLQVPRGPLYEFYVVAPRGGLPDGARLLHARDVFDLAPGSEPAAGPEARLALAAFLAREEDRAGASALLVPPIVGDLEPLAAELGRRIEQQRTVEEERLEQRRIEARLHLATLFLDQEDRMQRLERDPERALTTIDRLLGGFGDVDEVVERRAELETLRVELRSPGGSATLADFVSAFGAGVPRFLEDERVELYYDFAAVQVPGWSQEGWTPDGAGWLAPSGAMPLEELAQRAPLRLVLRRPLEVDDGVVVVEFEFDEPATTGPDRLVLISALGFHLVIGAPVEGGDTRLAVSSRSLAAAVDEFATGGGRTIASNHLAGGRTHILRLEIDKRRGRLTPTLDGESQRRFDLASPLGEPGAFGIALRTRERVRMRSLRVVAGR